MCRLVETIQINNGEIINLDLHNARMNKSRKDLFSCDKNLHLEDYIKISLEQMNGIYKCRVVYNEKIIRVEFLPYNIRTIRSLKLVECNSINYAYKYEDRVELNRLAAMKENADEILIIKNGFITDTSYTNVAFFNGLKWFTPRTPLLAGVKRQQLLLTGKIEVADITPDSLGQFEKVSLINSMIGLEQLCVQISSILK